MNNTTLLIIIVLSFMGFMVICGTIAGICLYNYFRHWIFVITKSNQFTFIRGYLLGGRGFEIKKKKNFAGEYTTPPGTIGSFRGQKAVFIREGVPCALNWPIPPMGSKGADGKDIFHWEFIDSSNMIEIMNTHHVDVVARAGQKQDPLRDMIILMLLIVILLVLIYVALKVGGVIKGKDVPVPTPPAGG